MTEVGEPLPKLAGLGLSPVRQIKPELKTGNKMRASAQLNRAHALLAICLFGIQLEMPFQSSVALVVFEIFLLNKEFRIECRQKFKFSLNGYIVLQM